MRTEDEQILQDWIPSGDVVTRFFNYENMIAFAKHYMKVKQAQELPKLTAINMNLQLSLKKQWFEMTKSGVKTEDYREINGYWIKRLMSKGYNRIYRDEIPAIKGILEHGDPKNIVKNHSKNFDVNTMTLGYPKSTDSERILKLEHKGIEIGYGKPEWGAEPNKLYFIIKHGAFLH